MATSNYPIGIFDSGVGGLTVLSALMRRLPHEQFMYLGDIARLPYGIKSNETITKYALQASSCLVNRGIKCLVIACNTATAAALPSLRLAYPNIPIIGVIEPGAEAAVKASKNANILVLATEATVNNGAYQKAIFAKNPRALVEAVPCSLFVSLAEEGWVNPQQMSAADFAIAEAIAHRYLDHIFLASAQKAESCFAPDCVVLGCTHFPLLVHVIQKVVGDGVAIVDSAETTARAVEHELIAKGLQSSASVENEKNPLKSIHFLTTDSPERFARIGSIFLSLQITAKSVELVSL